MNDDESVNVSKEEEEYVLIDLDEVARDIDIPAEAPYILSVSYFPFLRCSYSCICFSMF